MRRATPSQARAARRAGRRHLARLTFWSVNRDSPCTGGGADICSGISQQPWDFTRVFAQYTG
ncbi:hypothetical protein [Streptomyces sp. V1I1]|uniref:hypothetical protein n=1 Tax=Streptomyces sp. V1I1 TaxID=3042272 RepID=UPI00278B5BF1|nr:hypothetical protein [Streptomyces sp. V1I1]MDQ0938965.1 hypothetical protein [Streptomyces sp. V1I1]